jgi:hypothetical protein
MAARGARAAASKAADNRVLGDCRPFGLEPMDRRLVQRLRELGWIEGRTVVIEYRWAEGRGERFAEIAAEFVRLKVDVIVTVGGAVLAAKQVTSVIPIVFAVAADPVSVVSWGHWRDRVATSQAYRSSKLTRLASDSSSCASFFLISADWRSWPMSAIPLPCWI